MKTTHIRIFTLGIACCSGLALAQEGGRRPEQEREGGRMAEFIKKVDANGDGKITKEEFLNYSKKEAEDRFAKIDTNADGTVDENEIKAAADKIRGDGRRGGDGGFRRGEGQGGDGGFRRPSEGGAPGRGDGPPGQGRPEGAPPPPPEGQRPEGAPAREGGRGPGGPGGFGALLGNPDEAFKKMDKNGDGFVDAAEYKEFSSEEIENRFKRIDANGDGKVSLEEMKEALGRMREMMRRGGMGGPGGGEGGFRRPPGGPEGGQGGQGGFRRPPTDAPDGDRKPGGV